MSLADEMANLAKESREADILSMIRVAAGSGRNSTWIPETMMSDQMDLRLSREDFRITACKRDGNRGWTVSWSK